MTNIQTKSLEDAIEIALQVHKGELREDSEDVPLIFHLTQVANLVHHACNLEGDKLKEALIISVLHESFNNIDSNQEKVLRNRLENNFGTKIMKNVVLLRMQDKGNTLMEKSKIFTRVYYEIDEKDNYLLCVLIADTISSMIKLIKQFPKAKYEEVDRYLNKLELLVQKKDLPKELKFMWNQKCEEVRRLFS